MVLLLRISSKHFGESTIIALRGELRRKAKIDGNGAVWQ